MSLFRTLSWNADDFAHMRWLGSNASATALFAAPVLGTWTCIEAHAKLNTAGQADGVFELFFNGTLQASRHGMNWVGNYSEFGFNTVMVENYWNEGSVQKQSRFIDNLVVSTKRIGCLD
jgi:hypothetical protein